MLFIILTLVAGERTIAPKQKPVYELIPHTQYSANVESTLILQYNSYPGVYSMELGQVNDGEYQKMNANKTLDPFLLEGCYPFDRRLIYKHLVQQHVDQGDYFFTNMYVDQNMVFVTRNDNQLLTFKIITDDEERAITDLKFIESRQMEGTSDSHTIVCSNQSCVIFTENSAFIYKDKQFSNLNLQQYPIDVYFDEKTKVLYLSYGLNTVEIYLFEEKLVLLTTLTLTGKIVQTRTNPEGTKLYLLDAEQGLLMYNIVSLNQYEDSGFVINLRKGEAFDFYQDTFFIVARTNDDIPYALEIFVNQKDYYFNKIYSKDMDIFDVWVGEHFAILIGSEIHRVIYHSVYNKIIAESESPLFFQDLDLVNVEEYTPLQWNSTVYLRGAIEQDPFQKAQIHYKQSFMVGISRNDLSIFAIKNISPWLQCKPSDTSAVHYSLQLNSTTCTTKQHENDYSPFKQCRITHNFTLIGNQVLFYQEDKHIVLIGGCVLGQFVYLFSAAILLLIIAVIAAKRYFKYKLGRFIIDANSPRPLEEVEFETSPEEQMVIQ